ncbi:uncharacterized protein LOC100737472 [Sus scrofa]|uniref:uncharacterized protein LOC100737472 n=1 Tax=Sus scrofa TaxID=9823 RepID=UPI000A2B6C98|nr:uncharacterized protein LOC100737472 [Sus scrofa]
MRSLCLRPAEGSRGSGGQIKSPLDEGRLRPCCSLGSSGEENGPHGRTLASGAAGLIRPGLPEPLLGIGEGQRGRGLGEGIWGRGAGSAKETCWEDLRQQFACRNRTVFRGNQSICRKQKWKSRFGKSCHFPDSSGAGQGRRLGAAERPFLPPQLVPRLPEGRSTLLTPLLPHTRPRSPAGPFPHLLLPSSEKSLVPEPVYAVAYPSPLPRGCPLQPSLLPPPRFHSIDFCCMSTLIPVCSGTGPPARSPGLDPLSLSLWGDETKSRFHCPGEDSGADTECDLEPRLVASRFLGSFLRSTTVNSPLNSASLGGYLGEVPAHRSRSSRMNWQGLP